MSASAILFITSLVLILTNFSVRYFFGFLFKPGTIFSNLLEFTDRYFIKIGFIIINFLSSLNRKIQRIFRIFPRMFFDLFHGLYVRLRDNTIRFLYRLLSIEKRKSTSDKVKIIIGGTQRDETHQDSR